MNNVMLDIVFPVPTGMNRVSDFVDASGYSVPRAHGDEPTKLHVMR